MAFFDTLVNAYGGEWFNMQWQPQLTSDAWKSSIKWYLDVMAKAGPPGATANGHNENRALFATGKCAIWIDATSAAGYIYNPKDSQVADKTAFTASPILGARHSSIVAEGGRGEEVPRLVDVDRLRETGRRHRRLGFGASRNAAVDLRQP